MKNVLCLVELVTRRPDIWLPQQADNKTCQPVNDAAVTGDKNMQAECSDRCRTETRFVRPHVQYMLLYVVQAKWRPSLWDEELDCSLCPHLSFWNVQRDPGVLYFLPLYYTYSTHTHILHTADMQEEDLMIVLTCDCFLFLWMHIFEEIIDCSETLA